jgi:hypothetical protein
VVTEYQDRRARRLGTLLGANSISRNQRGGFGKPRLLGVHDVPVEQRRRPHAGRFTQ